MTEPQFREQWRLDQASYRAWGQFVVAEVSSRIEELGEDTNMFFKVPPQHRLKDESSLIDKAFYRPGKTYTDPYHEIEDKVGVRFVVLLLEDLKKVCKVIEEGRLWSYSSSRHFQEERDRDPLIFTYQSVHYILRPAKALTFNGVDIGPDTPCEVQVRTLLQHAHAELTHDAIYKAKKKVEPSVHRTVAKSMALIETTDDFFTEVWGKISWGAVEQHLIIERLDEIYAELTGLTPFTQKSAIAIWDAFEQLADTSIVENVRKFSEAQPFITEAIKRNYEINVIYRQSTILFIYWMLKHRSRRLLMDWPLPKSVLEPLANDAGIALDW